MFRLWAKIFKSNHMLRDTVICDAREDTRTHKVFHALDEICSQWQANFDKNIEVQGFNVYDESYDVYKLKK